MITMKFTKEKVLAKLTSNLEEHRTIFEEAVEGYRVECRKQLDTATNRLLDTPGPVNVYVSIAPPEDHSAEYEAVISMLEHTLDTEIDFTEEQYRHYMLDEWSWMRQFLGANSRYSLSATAKAMGMAP